MRATTAYLIFLSIFYLGSRDLARAQENSKSLLEKKVNVDAQPLAANIRRLLEAIENVGFPLDAKNKVSILEAIASNDATKIQQEMDRVASLVLEIGSIDQPIQHEMFGNSLQLIQNEHKALIVKVINTAESKLRLIPNSPHDGAVYAGTSMFSLNRQKQTELGAKQNENSDKNRYLNIDIYEKSPMTRGLSGLKVEYMILLLHCNRPGRSTPEVSFFLQPKNQDERQQAVKRNRAPNKWVLDVSSAKPVQFAITDPTQRATNPIARIEIRDQHGRIYPNQPKRVAPDLFFQPQVYRRSGEFVYLKPGKYSVRYCRGPEYKLLEKDFNVLLNEENVWRLELDRWIDTESFGFYSGDHHIHAAGCSHYTSPTQGVTPEHMYRQVTGEGLNVGCVLTWGPCFDHQRNFFDPKASFFENQETLVKYDIEVSGFGSQALGHVCLLNLSDQTYPNSEGTKTKGWPSWTTPVMRWAKKQGGYTGYAHSASGLAIDPNNATNRLLALLDKDKNNRLSKTETSGKLMPFPFGDIDRNKDNMIDWQELNNAHKKSANELPNFSIPEMNGVGAMEICVSAAEGVCDFISAMDTARVQEWNTWYHLLNCGFPMKVSGETDFPCMSSRRVGKGRVYVDMGKKLSDDQTLSFPKWCEYLAKGRSYVSDGFAHATEFSVGGKKPGWDSVQLKKPGAVKVAFAVAFAPQTPNAVAHGTQTKQTQKNIVGDTVELHHPREHKWITGGTRKVEIIVNGKPVATKTVKADGKIHSFEHEVEITQSSWVAIRQFPQLHTNPVNVLVNKKPIRASRKSALWCIGMTELLWTNRQRTISPNERPAAQETFARALSKFAQIADESKD